MHLEAGSHLVHRRCIAGCPKGSRQPAECSADRKYNHPDPALIHSDELRRSGISSDRVDLPAGSGEAAEVVEDRDDDERYPKEQRYPQEGNPGKCDIGGGEFVGGDPLVSTQQKREAPVDAHRSERRDDWRDFPVGDKDSIEEPHHKTDSHSDKQKRNRTEGLIRFVDQSARHSGEGDDRTDRQVDSIGKDDEEFADRDDRQNRHVIENCRDVPC